MDFSAKNMCKITVALINPAGYTSYINLLQNVRCDRLPA